MPVLLLSQGDAQAKDLLRRAIEARYGIAPPAIDSLKIDLKGRVRARLGPITTWLPVKVIAQFRFPNAMRLDFAIRPVGVTLQHGIDGFDGTTYRVRRGSSSLNVIDDVSAIRSHHSRLWAMAGVLLTPLGEHFVELKAGDKNCFTAVNTLFNDSIDLCLRADHSLQSVEVTCHNPDTQREEPFILQTSAEQAPVDGLMMPGKIRAFWGKSPYFEIEPVRVDANPTINDAVFALQALD
jgi:hypothetical protein